MDGALIRIPQALSQRESRAIRFGMEMAGARKVSVVGSFNQWKLVVNQPRSGFCLRRW